MNYHNNDNKKTKMIFPKGVQRIPCAAVNISEHLISKGV